MIVDFDNMRKQMANSFNRLAELARLEVQRIDGRGLVK